MPEKIGPEIEPKIIIYNKLVRDGIPEIIEADGATCETRILEKEEYITELSRKLSEEATEFGGAKDREEQVKELADLAEVVFALQTELEISPEDVEKERKERQSKRGGFSKKIFLVSTEGGGYGK